MAHILRLRQSSTTLCDFQDVTKYGLREFSEYSFGQSAQFGVVKLVLDIRGTSQTDALDNLTTLMRTLEACKRNYFLWQASTNYTPIYLQWEGSTVTSAIVQTECFGLSDDSEGALEQVLARPEVFLSGRIENVTLSLKVRPYWEETSAQSLVSGATVANAQDTSTSGSASVRGDLPAPLTIKVVPGASSQDTLIVAMRSAGTPGSYSAILEAGTYNARGSNVANTTDANLKAATPQRWSPASTSEQLLLRWSATMTADNVGTFRAFVRCRDNNATANVKIRMRAGNADASSNIQYGDYGADAKFVNTVGGTTAISWIDCGVIRAPATATGGALTRTRIIELRGQALAASSSFDIDYVLLVPLYEDAVGGGYCAMTLSSLTSGGAMVINANDRSPAAYSEASSTVNHVASNIIGAPLYAMPNQQFYLWYVTLGSTTSRHTHNVNNTVTVTATPRYRLGRGT